MVDHQIRSARIADSRQLAVLGKENFPGYPFSSIFEPKTLARDIMAMNIVFDRLGLADYRVVAQRGKNIVGTAVLGRAEGRMREIKRVLVDQSERGNGLAKEMTVHLAGIARTHGFYPWADVRADQIGMQRSALAAGMQPVSLDQSKHVVYSHKDGDPELGPARETMIHMTSISMKNDELIGGLNRWPKGLVETLITNMKAAHQPQPKNIRITTELLPDASTVKQRVENQIRQLNGACVVTPVNGDIDILTIGNDSLLIVKPDASAFVISQPDNDLPQLLGIASQIGLQTTTYYGDVDAVQELDLLQQSGMQPVMVRPWQGEGYNKPRWQVGWRAAGNGYQDCQHVLNLDPNISKQLLYFISKLEELIR